MDYYAIGQRIRKIRKAKGLSQEQIAEKVGISVTHMSHIETGNTKLSLEVFAAIVNSLDCRADELLFGTREIIGAEAFGDIVHILQSLSARELCIISDIVKSTAKSLKIYRQRLTKPVLVLY